MKVTELVKHGIIVSCQALPHEPLYGSETMAKMAKAAEQGGAVAIRANTKADIVRIKRTVSLPVIGIVKREYAGSDVYITPTTTEVDELVEAGADMIAFDATPRPRPDGCTLEELVLYMKERGLPAIADISTLEEAAYAESLGVAAVATTLSGYTPYSPRRTDPDFELVAQAARRLRIPVFAEGRVSEPAHVSRLLGLGAHCVVVGGAITRPQLITHRFVAAAKQGSVRTHGHQAES
ncbi:N-acetylmannosamine-6-phosphate 2-epimerase [Paenibacillus sp.]|uniref:N-acetylmannosamine-6-phosphate 2-epimerase n=1 Tax=Paenibacillus sp. TaxID=58172 RepID=UPI002D548AED|nr:N-acetylmannosamine-6-phosphate 2-epimerase [Paenibacillus sp.]HZG86900.1 N-acetylmannosamine-6-phosphate 2-epimerase [Paenibacillus sp.]